MKINLNHSAKRVLSLVLVFAVLIGSLFTANIGVNIMTQAATDTTLTIKYWSGGTSAPTKNSDGSYTINTAEELAYIVSNGDKYNLCTNFKVADGIDAFVMQPADSAAVTLDEDKNGVADILELSDYTETQEFFTRNDLTFTPWVAGDAAKPFGGNFDGNGVAIYGLYFKSNSSNSSNTAAGLFPYVGGAFNATADATWTNGITLTNFAVRNSYLVGTNVGAIIAREDDDRNTASDSFENAYKGRVTVKKAEVTNCYLESTASVGYYQQKDSETGEVIATYPNSISVGIVLGTADGLGDAAYGHHIIDFIAYGNIAATPNPEYEGGLWGNMTNQVSTTNDYKDYFDGFYKFSNILMLGSAPRTATFSYNNTYATNFSNVYTDVDSSKWAYATTKYFASQITVLGATYAAKGGNAKVVLDVNWAGSDTTDTDSVVWYARANDYPTLFPANDWLDIEATPVWKGTKDDNGGKFAADADGNCGDGTAESPYLIETPAQLYAMVCSSGKDSEGNQIYYKVKDGVTDLYLSSVIGGNLATIKSLAGTGTVNKDYYNWLATTPFFGNFDGNGVTIHGMISKGADATEYVGLFYSLGEDSIVKNINFDACYAYHSERYYAAILTSDLIHFQDENADGTVDTGGKKDGFTLICNVSVRESYIYSSFSSTSSYCGGIVASANLTDMLEMSNCLFDGYSCELGRDINQTYENWGSDYDAGIAALSGANNIQISGCVSLGQPVTSQPIPHLYANADGTLKLVSDTNSDAFIQGYISSYNDYSTGTYCTVNAGATYNHPAYFYNCYTDTRDYQGGKTEAEVREALVAEYNNEKSTAIPESVFGNTTVVNLIDENNASVITADYDYITNMPLLDWVNGWEVVEVSDDLDKFAGYDTYKVPMPRTRTAQDVAAINGSDTGYAVMSYNMWLGTQEGYGACLSAGPYESGTYGYYDQFTGAGTAADPYIISTPLELARAIGAGGVNINQNCCFKLANDIDLSGMPWLSTIGYVATSGSVGFAYVPFVGTLDGNGHTITGLYAVNGNTEEIAYNKDASYPAGLIPVLASGGVVKNLHIRNSYAGSGTGFAGALVGEAQLGSTVTGCSAESCVVVSNGTVEVDGDQVKLDYHIFGSVASTISNLYYIAGKGSSAKYNTIYVDAQTTLYTADDYVDTDITNSVSSLIAKIKANDANASADVWYIGGKEGSMPKLVNRAAAMTEVDVAGDDNAEYNTADLTALRNKLLRKSAYQYIYGDVNRDGNVNLGDLVILRRAIANDYKDFEDGFWRKLELGMVKIYYGENDNYDAARKLELYLESLYDVDIQKVVSTSKSTVSGAKSDSSAVYLHEGTITGNPDGTTDGYIDIIVGDVNVTKYKNSLADNKYAITYTDGALWLQGENFTAVEQAVLDFISNTDAKKDTYVANKTVYTLSSATLSTEKQPVTVGGQPYYYAWGDEFKGIYEDETGLNYGTWLSESQQSEAQNGVDSSYRNQEVGTIKSLEKLLVVSGGKLSMKRGYDSSLGSSVNGFVPLTKGTDYVVGGSNGYTTLGENDQYFSSGKLVTDRSMLFKQGYIEMMASIPADGHAFPAFWLMGNTTTGSHSNAGWTQSLFSKVYKLNNAENDADFGGVNAWDGTTNIIDHSDLTTFKYQIPSSCYEIDIFELMQSPDRSGYQNYTTAIDYFGFNLTIHKWYSMGVNSNTSDAGTADDQLYLIDWDSKTKSGPYTFDSFNATTAGWTHRFEGQESDAFWVWDSDTWVTDVDASREKIQAMRKYGFLWTVNGDDFECTLYIYNTDGTLLDSLTINQDTEYQNDSGKLTDTTYTGDNADVMNRYMYMLIDNKFYTCNYKNGEAYTDMLTAGDQTSFDIDYVRIYQLDGRRDIVTPDTEAFNNSNHFGY